MLSEIPFEVPPYLLDRIEGMDRVRMAIAGADHPIALKSAHQGADAGLIDPVLVGEADVIRAAASDRAARRSQGRSARRRIPCATAANGSCGSPDCPRQESHRAAQPAAAPGDA